MVEDRRSGDRYGASFRKRARSSLMKGVGGARIDSAVLWAVIASSDVAVKRRVGALRSWLKCKPDFNLQANGIIAVVDAHLISLARPFPFRSADRFQ